ncbi:unnamed protein product, partial [Arabidopsis halleri]
IPENDRLKLIRCSESEPHMQNSVTFGLLIPLMLTRSEKFSGHELGLFVSTLKEMAQRRLRSRSCKTWCPLPSIPEEGPIHACFLRKRVSPLLGFHFFCDQIFSLLDMLKSKATRLRNYLARTFTRSLSGHEITLSESYTCITFHRPNQKTIHIFGNCILYDP